MSADGLEDAPQLQLDIDRDKASALGVTFDAINTALSTALGSAYVNDFPNRGRLQRVIVQADAPAPHAARRPAAAQRAQRQGQPVPLSAFATARLVTGPMQTSATTAIRRCASPATRAPGYTTGEAMHEMERLAAQLPPGFGYEWTGQSRRKSCPARRRRSCSAFRCCGVPVLAALYESWSIPLAVLLVVPLGVLGAVLARDAARHAERRLLQGRPDHHHRPVGEERDPDHRVREGPAGAGQGR